MDDAVHELTRSWLIKARNDLETAQQIGTLPGGHLDAAIYHCQQAGEKALKGFLVFQRHRLERTHDLMRLVDLAATYEPGFATLADAAIILTPYATAYRYPGEMISLEPSKAEFEEAVVLAGELLSQVLASLPSEILG